MHPTDTSPSDTAHIIPFTPCSFDKNTAQNPTEEVSTIVAIVAVTLRHNSDEAPDQRLADLIEWSGEAEILDVQDACSDLGAEVDASLFSGNQMPQALNDNHNHKL